MNYTSSSMLLAFACVLVFVLLCVSCIICCRRCVKRSQSATAARHASRMRPVNRNTSIQAHLQGRSHIPPFHPGQPPINPSYHVGVPYNMISAPPVTYPLSDQPPSYEEAIKNSSPTRINYPT